MKSISRIAVALLATVTLTAGSPGSAVPSRPDDKTILHVLNRIGYGARPGDVERVKKIGLAAYIDQQLHPERIADSGMSARLAGLPTLKLTTRQLADEYFIPAKQLARWEYLKGAKRVERHHKGSDTPYFYVEGPIPFPDRTDWPARTILTGEGGRTPSRFKHIIAVGDGRYRRLTPRELERLNGFPDDWTATGMPAGRRAFVMGNALIVGLVERVGRELMAEARPTPETLAIPVMDGTAVAS